MHALSASDARSASENGRVDEGIAPTLRTTRAVPVALRVLLVLASHGDEEDHLRTIRFDARRATSSLLSTALALTLLSIAGCSDRSTPDTTDAGRDAGGRDSGSEEIDASTPSDAGSDAGTMDDAGSDAGTMDDAGSDAGSGPVCAPPGIGAACDDEGGCQTGLRCYSGTAGDFCSVDRSPDCGGFVMARCPASAPYCLRPLGSSLGACATEEEAICICAIASDLIQPGEGTEGCPRAP